jgi:hypothetical protein
MQNIIIIIIITAVKTANLMRSEHRVSLKWVSWISQQTY